MFNFEYFCAEGHRVVDVFAVSSVVFVTLARGAHVAFEMSSSQIVQVVQPSACTEVNVSSLAARAPIWNLSSVVLSTVRVAAVASMTANNLNIDFISELLIILGRKSKHLCYLTCIRFSVV